MLSWGWGFDNKKSNMNKLNEWGFRYTWYMPLINQRDTWLIWLRYAWDMTEIWLRHALDMPELCLRDAWDMPYMTHMTDTCGWDMSEICLRGAIIKKNGKFWEKFPNGGGDKIFFKKVPILIWEHWKSRGCLIFSKMSEFQLFCNYFAILPL